ncbi:hypothetical protein [Dongia sp.]|uniref:hypothetical protein n=1 Tax=Dongia sp. TaxID=1977262 RepID=UPI0035B1A195
MSITMLNAVGDSARLFAEAEKDAQQKSAEANASSAFAGVLAQTGTASDVAVISGKPHSAVIPAVLIDAGAADAGNTTLAATLAEDESVTVKDATETFLEFASKTPAEKMRAMILAEMGLTEEALQNLDAKTRAEIEEKIRIRIEAKIRQGIEEKSGVVVSSSLTPSLPIYTPAD